MDGPLNALPTVCAERALAHAETADRRVGIGGTANCREGPDRRRRRPHHLRVADLRRQRARPLRHPGRAARGARRRRRSPSRTRPSSGPARRPSTRCSARPETRGTRAARAAAPRAARRSRSRPGRCGSRPAPTWAAACARRRRSARSSACGRRRGGSRAARPSSRSTRSRSRARWRATSPTPRSCSTRWPGRIRRTRSRSQPRLSRSSRPPSSPELPARIAWSDDLGITPLEPEVRAVCRAAVERLAAAGVEIAEAHPDLGTAPETFQALRAAGFVADLGPLYETDRDRLKPEIVGNIELGLALPPVRLGEAAARPRPDHPRDGRRSCASTRSWPARPRASRRFRSTGAGSRRSTASASRATWSGFGSPRRSRSRRAP